MSASTYRENAKKVFNLADFKFSNFTENHQYYLPNVVKTSPSVIISSEYILAILATAYFDFELLKYRETERSALQQLLVDTVVGGGGYPYTEISRNFPLILMT